MVENPLIKEKQEVKSGQSGDIKAICLSLKTRQDDKRERERKCSASLCYHLRWSLNGISMSILFLFNLE